VSGDSEAQRLPEGQGQQGTPRRGDGRAVETGTGQGWALWARLGRAHGWSRQGCGELETGPAVALLGQGLMALWGPRWGLGPWWCPEDSVSRLGLFRALHWQNDLVHPLHFLRPSHVIQV